MKKATTLLTLLFLITVLLPAREIGILDAKKTGKNFYFRQASFFYENAARDQYVLSEAYQYARNGQTLLYVFNVNESGFVMVSGQSSAFPVLAYSFEGSFDAGNHSPAFTAWIDHYLDQIEFLTDNPQYSCSDAINAWDFYLNADEASLLGSRDDRATEPLLLSKWGQGKYYNTMCPFDPAGEDDHALVGCVATAMSQIMFFYRYPLQGTGSHGYMANNSSSGYGDYGYLEANFGNTQYQYDGMQNKLSSGNLAVAELCYHCGVAVDMSYGPNSSGAFTADVPNVIRTYFGYNNTAHYIQKMNYTTASWLNLLISNLDQNQPLIYSGRTNTSEGHAWVCDGYQGTDYIHFNWGWDGYDDGYFYLNDLTTSQGNFSYNQSAVRNIYPASTYPPYCSGAHTLTHSKGTFEDGSGAGNYQDNSSCSWLIAPSDSVTRITLSFDQFDLESNNDLVKIYDGSSATATLLATYSGSDIPEDVSSTSNRMFITFESNGSVVANGFHASFKSNYPEFCGGEVYTASSGTISDGSGTMNYLDNTTCNFTIQPPFATSLTLTFTAFDTEEDYDFVEIYDLETQELLAKYSGHVVPAAVTATSGSMFIIFKTNHSFNFQGWEATYAAGNMSVPEQSGFKSLSIFPNPAEDMLRVSFSSKLNTNVSLDIMTITGEEVYSSSLAENQGIYETTVDLSGFSKGIYILRLTGQSGSLTQKVIVK